MTKVISSNLAARVALDATTLATLWKITRRDDAVFTFTDHDQDIIYAGLTYSAQTGYEASEVATSGKLNVDNLEIQSFFDADSILESDVAAGLWDRARVDMMVIDYNFPSYGVIKQRRGETGVFQLRGNRFVSELRGLMQYLQNNIGRIYTAPCDATLGDARCTVDLTSDPDFQVDGTVTTATSRQTFTDTSLGQADQWFQYGVVEWLTGDNAGYKMEVRTFAAGVVELQLPMVGEIQVGDTFTITTGCDKQRSTCIAKFDNVVNFRGFADIPGLDRMIVADPR